MPEVENQEWQVKKIILYGMPTPCFSKPPFCHQKRVVPIPYILLLAIREFPTKQLSNCKLVAMYVPRLLWETTLQGKWGNLTAGQVSCTLYQNQSSVQLHNERLWASSNTCCKGSDLDLTHVAKIWSSNHYCTCPTTTFVRKQQRISHTIFKLGLEEQGHVWLEICSAVLP